MLKVFKGKEVLFNPHKSKTLNKIVYFPPHGLRVDPELEDSSVFQPDQQLQLVLLVGILVQFLYLAKWEVNQFICSFDEDLVVTQDESDSNVVTGGHLREDEFAVDL